MTVVTLKSPEPPAADNGRSGAGNGRSGMGMDKPVETRRLSLRSKLVIAATALVIALGTTAWLVSNSAGSQTVDAANLTISTVYRGTFDDFVPLRARVTPSVTVFLDAVEGGRIDRLLVEDGAAVTVGQPLAVLSNATLQLDVIAREADVSQQLNNLRSQELELQRSRLENRRNLAEIEWQVRKASRQLDRDARLAANGWVSGKALKDSEDEARYLRERRAVTVETLATEERLQASQLTQLRSAASGLTANLRLARASLDALVIRAPVAGQLSGFSPQIGQSLARGERLGQIDSAGRNKLVADIDEFYLGRIMPGQKAVVEWQGRAWPLHVTKIYPQVTNGSFTADLSFDREGNGGPPQLQNGAPPQRQSGGPPQRHLAAPPQLQRGQTLQPRLTLGDPAPAVMVANGAFYSDSGGNFVFVVGKDGRSAEKRAVRLGRRNPDAIEVIGGLNPGDRVITSAYTGFADKTRLKISGE